MVRQVRNPGRPLASTGQTLAGLCFVMTLRVAGRPERRSRAQASPQAAGALLVACLALLSLAGCNRSVAISPPAALAPDVAQTCEALSAALPDDLDPIGKRRAVTPDSAFTAAWGDPPAALRCGVPTPTGLTTTATLVSVNGVDWYPEELTDGYLLTTVGRVANVELTVPRALGPAPSMAAGLADVIKANVPKVRSG